MIKTPQDYKLPPQDESKELVFYGYNPFGKEIFMSLPTYLAWSRLKDLADKANIKIAVFSAYRSIQQQEQIINNKLAKNISLTDILAASALPGYSEHHTARAIDFYIPGEDFYLEERFSKTNTFSWLVKNAKKFGFSLSYPLNNKYGLDFEPWHWIYEEK